MRDDGFVVNKRKCNIDWKLMTFQSAVDQVCYECTRHMQAVAAAAWYRPSQVIWQFVLEMHNVIHSA